MNLELFDALTLFLTSAIVPLIVQALKQRKETLRQAEKIAYLEAENDRKDKLIKQLEEKNAHLQELYQNTLLQVAALRQNRF